MLAGVVDKVDNKKWAKVSKMNIGRNICIGINIEHCINSTNVSSNSTIPESM
jgi:hypothetical protein